MSIHEAARSNAPIREVPIASSLADSATASAPDETATLATALTAAETVIRSLRSPMNAYEVTVERLSAAIKMGLYHPGDQLPAERDLAELMGVSRTTLREAIRVLAAQGFLQVKRGRSGGTFVLKPQRSSSVRELNQTLLQAGSRLQEILDFRFVVEPGVAELAAQRISSRQIEELAAIVKHMEQVVDQFSQHRRLDTEFHLRIAQATQSDRLVATVAGIHAELSNLLSVIPHSAAACLDSTQQHQQILSAICNGQSDHARSLMADHIARTSSLLNGLLG